MAANVFIILVALVVGAALAAIIGNVLVVLAALLVGAILANRIGRQDARRR